MEHTFAVTFIALLLTAVITLGAVSLTAKAKTPETDEAPAASEISPAPKEPKMRLGIYEGYLALYSGSGRYPTEIYSVMIRSLPEEDRKKLGNGIELSSEAELREILEDYSS